MIKENGAEVRTPENNRIVGPLDDSDCVVEFKGSGNILFVEENVRLVGSRITFNGSDAVVYLSGGDFNDYKLQIDAWSGTTYYFGKNNYFNGPMHAIASERQNIIIGGGGVFSFGVWIRTADPYLIYDIETGKRVNASKSVVIGDHVWLGQDILITKGTVVGSGSIIGGHSVVAAKRFESNFSYGGNPAKKVKSNIFFLGESVHDFDESQTEKSMHSDEKKFIFKKTAKTIDTADLCRRLTAAKTSDEKLSIIQNELASCMDRSRLTYIPGDEEEVGGMLHGLKKLIR